MTADEAPRPPKMSDLSPGYHAAREREARVNRATLAAMAAVHRQETEREGEDA
ncbi:MULTISPECIES: hypothetical protein [unclassified Plantibacter]|uniref:hypothetical protein n=1 Tax=unclassified Plantibacter TaxID=2624265 RepID=UPI000B05CD11|nr:MULTISPECIES: hypothetical protein [unclassified Plantibacter]